ncbi:MAG: class I SAM-dependent RNA methyltransferase [Myxococcaceae bacterium]
MSNASETLFATTTPGLESVLAAEVQALGHTPTVVRGGVEWVAPSGGHRKANLWLRTANCVSMRSGEGRKRGGRALSGSIDTSGELLYRRGYRQEVSRAPMRETLAAGLLCLADYEPSRPLWDPMCGSGTFLIEAALLARGLPPGAMRKFAFEEWPSHDARAWEEERASAVVQAKPLQSGLIWGSDINAGALGTARRNAKRAGVLEALALFRADVQTLVPPRSGVAGAPPSGGLLITNLPYGRRLGKKENLEALYRSIWNGWHQNLPGWRAAFYVKDAALLEQVAQVPASRRFPVDNGGLHCTLLCWDQTTTVEIEKANAVMKQV